MKLQNKVTFVKAFAAAWVVGVAVNIAVLAGICWVVYKLLQHFGVI